MIEVNLFSIGSADSNIGRCVSRARYDREVLGVSPLEFVRGFLKDNLESVETKISSSELMDLISNKSIAWTRKDFATVSYLLQKAGYKVTIWNVAEDEENANSVPSGVLEWNIIDNNYMQHDYPTVTKIVPAESEKITETIKKLLEFVNLFDETKFKGIANPLTKLKATLDFEVEKTGNVNSAIVSQIYLILKQMGVEVFWSGSEH